MHRLKQLTAILLILLFGVMFTACQPEEPVTITPSPTTEPVSTLIGQLQSADGQVDTANRPLILCRIDPADGSCVLQAPMLFTNADGTFTAEALEAGRYTVIYASGLSDFQSAIQTWAGETLYPGDWPWLRDDFLALDPAAPPAVPLPADLHGPDVRFDRAAYALDTLLIDQSPFIIAHTISVGEDGWTTVEPLVIDVPPGSLISASIPVITPAEVDLEEVREQVGELTREEIPLLDRTLSDRLQRFLAGDDSAYRATDVHVIDLMRSEQLYEIGHAYFTAVETYEDQLVLCAGYNTVDVVSGDAAVVGWLYEQTGDVIEARTGYRLNVRDDPGVWIVYGEHGEQFYSYGFSYYRRWDQILPDPVIDLVEDFYTEGVDFVARNLHLYRAAAYMFDGEMLHLSWDTTTLYRMRHWLPTTAPFVHLPDSGTVDIRRERFFEAFLNGDVLIDEQSLETFLDSDIAVNGTYIPRPDPQEVRDAMLIPYRSGHYFSDLEAAIILDATYGSDGPLRITIDSNLEAGFLVPRYTNNEILVARDEVANVLLGYPGALNSRWAHEMGHVVDFRSEQYDFRSRPESGSRCEPVKYLMEFMWWVQRYPGDAPDWDWMPINSGLTLGRLLNEEFHNSGC
ncbi:MAG: hypothetical protein JXJ17_05985 [Anaerolineae bacterium]|nr:hypothetical protein [Anaerolineae bacterium]